VCVILKDNSYGCKHIFGKICASERERKRKMQGANDRPKEEKAENRY
jgi:hypothetical protein